MDGPLSGSSVAEALGRAFRLNSDSQRHGQEAFSASPFSRLIVTQVLSLGGDALVTLALAGSIFFSTDPHAARGRVALTLLLTIAPFAVVAPLLGPLVDKAKGGRRVMVVGTALGRVVACFLMARYIHSLLLFPAALLTLVCSKGYVVAKATLVPSVVHNPKDLVEANSKLAVGGAVAGFLIAIPGVAILKLAGARWVLWIDMFVFLACAASALRLPASAKGTARDHSALDHTAVLPGSAGPVNATPLAPGTIQVAAYAMGTLRSIVGFLTFLVAFAFRGSKGHPGAPAWWYGVVLICSLGGNLVGAAVAPWLRVRVREELILAGSSIAVATAGVAALFLDSLRARPAAALLAGVVGLAAGAAKLAFDSQVQRHVPAASQGRAFGRFEAGFQLVWVVGGLVPVVIPMSLPTGFLIVTVAATIAALVYLVGTHLAGLGKLPPWWPGVRPPAEPRRGRKPDNTPAPADVTVAFAPPAPQHQHTPDWRQAPGYQQQPGYEPAEQYQPWQQTPGHQPGERPPAGHQQPGYQPAQQYQQAPYGATVPLGAVAPWLPAPLAGDDEAPWLEAQPDLGTYPPPIPGPPPLGGAGRPVPPPLSGPPPWAAPLAPRPPVRRPPDDPPE